MRPRSVREVSVRRQGCWRLRRLGVMRGTNDPEGGYVECRSNAFHGNVSVSYIRLERTFTHSAAEVWIVPYSRPSSVAQRMVASRAPAPRYLSAPRHLSAASRRCGQARTRSTASRSVGRCIRTTGSPAEPSRPFDSAKRCVTPARYALVRRFAGSPRRPSIAITSRTV